LGSRLLNGGGCYLITRTPEDITYMARETINVKLATYMERLDRYIETQAALNANLADSLEKVHTNVEHLQDWRSRVSGARTGLIAVGLLITHTVVVLGSLVALVGWTNTR